MTATLTATLATVVSGVFAVALVRRWRRSGRAARALLLWAIALGMFCVASAALAWGTVAGWSEPSFRVFYLFGAVLNVPWLAAGSVEVNARSAVVTRLTGVVTLVLAALLGLGLLGTQPDLWLPGTVLALVWGAVLVTGHRDGVRALTTVLLVVFSAVGTVAVLSAALTAPLAVDGLPEGRDLFPLAVRGLAVAGNAVGAVIVIVSAAAASVTTVWRRPVRGAWDLARHDARWGLTDVVARWILSGRRGVQGVGHIVRGNLLIAFGVALASMGGALSFLGDTTGNAVGLGLGVSVMFLGFVRTQRPFAEPVRDRVVVTVLTRSGCGLCRHAEHRVAVEAPDAEIVTVDVDTDPALVERYGVRVPVVVVDGDEVAELELAPGVVRDAVRRARYREPARPVGAGTERPRD